MVRERYLGIWRFLRKGISVLGIVSLSVLVTLLVQRVVTPSRATAQSNEPQEIRASAFVLVGADGTVHGRLVTDPMGNGALVLTDPAGQPRSYVNGRGALGVYGANGNIRANLYVDAGTDTSGLAVRDPDGKLRINTFYNPANEYAQVRVTDADGNAIKTLVP